MLNTARLDTLDNLDNAAAVFDHRIGPGKGLPQRVHCSLYDVVGTMKVQKMKLK